MILADLRAATAHLPDSTPVVLLDGLGQPAGLEILSVDSLNHLHVDIPAIPAGALILCDAGDVPFATL